MFEIRLVRAYEDKQGEKDDGYRILVDRLWPRGIKKEELSFDWWPKEIAPSKELRQAFGHEESKFEDFRDAYMAELEANPLKEEFSQRVKNQLKSHNVTLIYGARDKEHNQAIVLKEWLESQ